jgi:hypothetical protein
MNSPKLTEIHHEFTCFFSLSRIKKYFYLILRFPKISLEYLPIIHRNSPTIHRNLPNIHCDFLFYFEIILTEIH